MISLMHTFQFLETLVQVSHHVLHLFFKNYLEEIIHQQIHLFSFLMPMENIPKPLVDYMKKILPLDIKYIQQIL